MTTVLLVEDDPKIRATVLFQLSEEAFATEAIESAEGALARLEPTDGQRPDLLLVDVRLPGMSGVELVGRLHEAGRLPPTIIISGEASITETVDALKLGVHDFIEKPFSKERLLRSIRNTLENTTLKREVAELRSALSGATPILGKSPAIEALKVKIQKAAQTDGRILIQGESGTGKELVADALHRGSDRHDRPFIKINCAAIPSHLIEDELFGHVRGAFTDAKSDKPGLFEEADGGTLFLDEIGDMNFELQSRLLRVLEDGRVRRIGGTKEHEVDVRVISATHADLATGVRDRTFREDLFFRLAHLPLEVPALRHRGQDVELLFDHFLRQYESRHRARPRRVDRAVLREIASYTWPGNVRELKNLCERLVVFGSDPITVDQLPPRKTAFSTEPVDGLLRTPADLSIAPLRDVRQRFESEYIRHALRVTGGNVTAAARQLDVGRSHLHQKMSALGIHRKNE